MVINVVSVSVNVACRLVEPKTSFCARALVPRYDVPSSSESPHLVNTCMLNAPALQTSLGVVLACTHDPLI
jgi:hypothetical protein